MGTADLERRASGDLPLSCAEERMWLLHQLDRDSPAYNIPLAHRLRGRLDVEALRAAFELLASRHEILRTSFPARAGRPVRLIAPAAGWALPVIDLSGLEAHLREAELWRRASVDASAPFDLARGPLLRTVLLRLGGEEHALLACVHHVISDGGSVTLLWRELWAIYGARVRGEPPDLPAIEARYVDHAVGQRRWLEGPQARRQLEYWRGQLAGAPAELALPYRRVRETERGGQGAKVSVALDPECWSGVRGLARRHRASPFMVLVAGLRALFARYCDHDDLCIGTPVTGRGGAAFRNVMGCFVNTLVLRTRVDRGGSFSALVEAERRTALEAYAHQQVPLEEVVEALGVARRMDRTPLFQVMIAYQDLEWERARISGLICEPLRTETEPAKVDLAVHVFEREERLEICFVCDIDRLERGLIEQLAGQYVSLLRAAVAEPGRPLAELSLLSDAERRRVLHAWNATERAIGEPGGEELGEPGWVHERFEAQVDRTPDAVAVRFEGGELTYRELDERCNRLANHLLAAGAGVAGAGAAGAGTAVGAAVDRPVAVLLERSLEMVIAVYGIVKAGAAFLPIDPGYPRHRVREVLKQSGATRVIGQARFAELVEGTGVEGIWLDLERDREALERQPCTRPAVTLDGDHLAYVIFTSGSTGQPKGVMTTHAGLRNRLLWMQEALRLASDDVVLQKTPLTFDVAVWELFWPLMVGARLVIARPEGHRDPAYLGELMRREQVTTLHFVPSMLEAFLAAERPGAWEGVRRVISSGEALTSRHVARFFAQSGAELINLYGPTEAAIDVSMWRCGRGEGDGGVDVPVGRPVANTRLYVLDRRLEPVPPGAVGELYIAGVQLARGYLGRPALTAERFVPDPHGRPGSRMYRTGDRARTRMDGTIEFLGRIDRQVKLRGFRIELGEIESVLAEHPGVRQCVAVVRHDAGHDELVAYVVPAAGGLDAAATRDYPAGIPSDQGGSSSLRCGRARSIVLGHLRERLPEYMVPAVVVLLERLPLTSSGKLDRGALPAPAERDRRPHAPVAPRTPAECTLSEIWSQLLGVEQVGVHDSFFSLGGDSILALRVLAQARDRGLRMTARSIFQHQTIAALAAALEQGSAGVEAQQGPVTGEVPLTPIQRSFLADAVDPNRYTMVQTLETDGPLDPDLLLRALTALAHQHDSLRARFVREGAGWSQVVSGSAESSVHLGVRREAAPEAHRLRELLEAANRAAHDRLDIASGPLLAVEYLELGPARGMLVLVGHHLIVDLVSWGVLIEDLERACGQLERGEVVALGAKGSSFQRWAERLREVAARPGFVDAEHWQRVARDARRAIPRDQELGPSTVGTSRTVAAWLDEDETAHLLGEVAGWYGASIDHVLLAALAEAFWQWAGSEELAVSVEGHGRLPLFDDLDISRTVGWFTTRYPVLLPRTGDDLVETLSAIGQRLREVPRGGVGHGLLRDLQAGEPGLLDAATEPEVAFNYLGHASIGAGGRGRFRASADEVGPLWDPGLRRPALIEVDCVVARGRLLCNWTYSTAHHRERTVQALARDHLDAVRRLLASGTRGTRGARIDRMACGPQGRAAQVLSHAQETFWRLHRLCPDSSEHTIAQAYRLRGALDVEALRRAFEELVRRHEVLRTVFPEREGAADPTVAPIDRWRLAIDRLDGAPGSPGDADLWRLAGDEAARPFDLAEDLPLRARLVRISDEDHLLSLAMHHIAGDGWSLGILWRELGVLYRAFASGAVPALGEVPCQMAEHAARQRRWVGSAEGAAHLAYWRAKLAGAPPEIRLGDRPRPPLPRQLLGAAVTLELGAELSERVRELGGRHGATPFVTLLAGFRALLASALGERDVCIGTFMANRSGREAEALIGPLFNTVVLRNGVAEDATFARLLAEEREVLAGAHDHQAMPFEEVVEAVGAPRCQILFASQHRSWDRMALAGLVAEPLHPPIPQPFRGRIHTARHDLAVHVVADDRRLALHFWHDEAVLDRGTVQDLCRRYRDLLAYLVANPDGLVGAFPGSSSAGVDSAAGA